MKTIKINGLKFVDFDDVLELEVSDIKVEK